jgi:hypothetical protein
VVRPKEIPTDIFISWYFISGHLYIEPKMPLGASLEGTFNLGPKKHLVLYF